MPGSIIPFDIRRKKRFAARRKERRSAHRPSNPHCMRCGPLFIARCVTRTDSKLYFQCGFCADVWSLPKPAPASDDQPVVNRLAIDVS